MEYNKVNSVLATGALKKISGHLWYLNEELVMLALFDDTGKIEEKLKRWFFKLIKYCKIS